MNTVAYVRVSTRDQKIDRQLEALKVLGVEPNNIYCDYQSGKDFNRPEYRKMKTRLKPGDLLIIYSIDRLGRNYEEILEEWKYITKVAKADIEVIDMPLLNTKQRDNNLTTNFVADIVLQLLAYISQKEREAIRQRQAEGIAAAKLKGKHFGRKEKDIPKEFGNICKECEQGNISIRQGASKMGMSYSTFRRKYIKQLSK